jgi:hypothetical protein
MYLLAAMARRDLDRTAELVFGETRGLGEVRVRQCAEV